jgi:hypothetical protein
MNSGDTGIESELPDLSTVPFWRLRALDDVLLRRAMRHVLERAGHLRAAPRSGDSGHGERID